MKIPILDNKRIQEKVTEFYKGATNEYKKAVDPKKVVEIDTATLKVEEQLKQREE